MKIVTNLTDVKERHIDNCIAKIEKRVKTSNTKFHEKILLRNLRIDKFDVYDQAKKSVGRMPWH